MKESPPKNVRKFRMFAEPVGSAIGKIAQPVLKKQGLEVGLLQHWNRIVGSELAAYCQPVKLQIPKGKKSGVLTVEILASHALVMQHMQSVMLEKLAAYHGYRAVERIQFKQCTHMPKIAESEQKISTEQAEMAEKFRALYASLVD